MLVMVGRLCWSLVVLVAGAALGAALLGAGTAQATPIDECLRAHEGSQLLRREGAWKRARSALQRCLDPGCPAPVRKDCAAWLAELDAAQPSLLVVVREAGGTAPAVGVLVTVDGEPLATPGRSSDIDPGSHVIRAQASDGRVVETRVLIDEGQQHRRLNLTLPPLHHARGAAGANQPAAAATAAATAPATANPPATAPPGTNPESAAGGSALEVGIYAALGLGVAGGAVFATLALVGRNREDAAAEQCAPSCDDEVVADIKRLYAAADTAGGVGIAALATAATLVIIAAARSDPADDHPTASLRVGPGAVLLEGRW